MHNFFLNLNISRHGQLINKRIKFIYLSAHIYDMKAYFSDLVWVIIFIISSMNKKNPLILVLSMWDRTMPFDYYKQVKLP